MADNTGIEWCDATFNPWWGCQKVSPACDHCYAERDAARFAPGRTLWGVDSERRTFGDAHWNAPLKWAKALPGKLGRRPRVFCASMGDVFDKDAPADQRARLFALIDQTPELDWLLLTKRIGNVPRMLEAPGMQKCGLPSNVWLGITVVSQEEADRDIPKLLAVPARVRFLSIEPMLGPIDLQRACTVACPNRDCFACGGARFIVDSENGGTHAECVCSRLNGLHWVICGGESGPGARPMHPDWPRGLRDQCAAAGVPFLFKQWGEWRPMLLEEVPKRGGMTARLVSDGSRSVIGDGCHHRAHALESMLSEPGYGWQLPVLKLGKRAAGRRLDDVEHNGYPA